jgi:hypothetical protein
MKNPFIFIASLVFTTLLTACATSGPTISAAQSPGINFGEFESFNYLPTLGTDRSNGARTTLSSRLIEAMNHEMATRGLRLSDTPDLLVDFNFVTREGIQVRQSPNMSMSSVHRSHWGRSYTVWGSYSTTVRQYTEGTLLIDIIDLENASLIGEGAAQGRSLGDMRDLDQGEINRIVADVMGQLMP